MGAAPCAPTGHGRDARATIPHRQDAGATPTGNLLTLVLSRTERGWACAPLCLTTWAQKDMVILTYFLER